MNRRFILTALISAIIQLGLNGETWIGKDQASNQRVISGYLGSSFTW